MPSLLNSDLAQNYRRVAVAGSNYGSRRIQFYKVIVYGVSDAEIAKLTDPDNKRIVNNTEIDIDQVPEVEYKSATVLEAIVRAIQSNGELYVVGDWQSTAPDPGYNELYIIVGIAGDTYSSGFEMDQRDDPATRNNNNPYLREALADALDSYLGLPNYDGYDVFPAYISGEGFEVIEYPNAGPRSRNPG